MPTKVPSTRAMRRRRRSPSSGPSPNASAVSHNTREPVLGQTGATITASRSTDRWQESVAPTKLIRAMKRTLPLVMIAALLLQNAPLSAAPVTYNVSESHGPKQVLFESKAPAEYIKGEAHGVSG